MPITKQKIEKWSGALALLVALVAGFYGVVSFVDNRIERRITEVETLKKIALLVRPFCIFDQSGSILYDSGAMQTIELIKLSPLTPQGDKEGRILPKQIVVRPRQLLREAPMLTVLDSYLANHGCPVKTEMHL